MAYDNSADKRADNLGDKFRDNCGDNLRAFVGDVFRQIVVGIWRDGASSFVAMKVAILKPGTFTGSTPDGKPATRSYTEDDCKRMVTLYNEQPAEQLKEAPLTLGHGKDTAPAFGWVDRLEFTGGHVWAHLKKVADNFKEWVDQGHYGPVSPSIRADGTLRHVAALGASPPAIPGLPSWVFGEGDDASFTFEFSEGVINHSADYRIGGVQGMLRRVREWFIQKEGLEVADVTIPNDELDALSNEPYDDSQWLKERLSKLEAKMELITGSNSSFSEGDMNTKTSGGGTPAPAEEKPVADAIDYSEELKARDTKIAELEAAHAAQAKINESQAKIISDLQAKSIVADFNEFLAPLEAQGRVTPGNRAIAMSMLQNAASVPGDVEYAEGDAAKTGTALDATKAMLGAWPVIANTSEVATAERAKTKARVDTGYEFSERDDVDQDSAALDGRAKAIAMEKSISYAEALTIARKEVN